MPNSTETSIEIDNSVSSLLNSKRNEHQSESERYDFLYTSLEEEVSSVMPLHHVYFYIFQTFFLYFCIL